MLRKTTGDATSILQRIWNSNNLCLILKDWRCQGIIWWAFMMGLAPRTANKLGDANWYWTGRVDRDNIVLTTLPAMDKWSAASVASSLQVSFPKITLAFLVGICGGVSFPSERTEIILGDVIISDRVVEYDFSRQHPHAFRQKGFFKESLGPANWHARTFRSALKTNRMHDRLQDDLLRYLQRVQQQLSVRWQYTRLIIPNLLSHKHYHLRFAALPLFTFTYCVAK
jgi:hypothetical protein